MFWWDHFSLLCNNKDADNKAASHFHAVAILSHRRPFHCELLACSRPLIDFRWLQVSVEVVIAWTYVCFALVDLASIVESISWEELLFLPFILYIILEELLSTHFRKWSDLNKIKPMYFISFFPRRWKRGCLQRWLWQWQYPRYSWCVSGEQWHQCNRLQEVPDGPLGSKGHHSNWSQLGGPTPGQRAGSDCQFWPRHCSRWVTQVVSWLSNNCFNFIWKMWNSISLHRALRFSITFVSQHHRFWWVQRCGLQWDDVREHGQRWWLCRLCVRLPVEWALLCRDVEADHTDLLGGQALQGLRHLWRFPQSRQLDYGHWRKPQECLVAHGQHSWTGGRQLKCYLLCFKDWSSIKCC